MLQQFFAFFIALIIFLVVLIIIKIAVPMWRFMVRADSVIKLYDLLKKALRMEFSTEGTIEVSYGKYKLKFANTNEARIEFEKIVIEALEYYDKLGWIATVDDTFKAQKDELINIRSEVRTLRWKNQGV